MSIRHIHPQIKNLQFSVDASNLVQIFMLSVSPSQHQFSRLGLLLSMNDPYDIVMYLLELVRPSD